MGKAAQFLCHSFQKRKLISRVELSWDKLVIHVGLPCMKLSIAAVCGILGVLQKWGIFSLFKVGISWRVHLQSPNVGVLKAVLLWMRGGQMLSCLPYLARFGCDWGFFSRCRGSSYLIFFPVWWPYHGQQSFQLVLEEMPVGSIQELFARLFAPSFPRMLECTGSHLISECVLLARSCSRRCNMRKMHWCGSENYVTSSLFAPQALP